MTCWMDSILLAPVKQNMTLTFYADAPYTDPDGKSTGNLFHSLFGYESAEITIHACARRMWAGK